MLCRSSFSRGVPTSTLSPLRRYTSTMRVLMGELITSSKAGTTLPYALMLASMVPLSTRQKSSDDRFTPLCRLFSAQITPPVMTAAASPHLAMLRIRLRRISSLGIFLSIYVS